MKGTFLFYVLTPPPTTTYIRTIILNQTHLKFIQYFVKTQSQEVGLFWAFKVLLLSLFEITIIRKQFFTSDCHIFMSKFYDSREKRFGANVINIRTVIICKKLVRYGYTLKFMLIYKTRQSFTNYGFININYNINTWFQCYKHT